ncbi:MAG: glycosyltransferase [Candidatus Eisenbacteria bacterium]
MTRTTTARDSDGPAKVVLWAGSFEYAGTQRFLVELLKRIDRSVLSPIVFSTRADGELLPVVEGLGVPVHEFGTGTSPFSPATASGLWRASRFLRRERVQVLCCMLGVTTLFGPFVGRMAGVPVVVNAQRNQGYWLGKGLRSCVFGYVSRRVVDGILVNSSAARDELTGRFGVRDSLIHDTGGGVDVGSISGADCPEALRREFGLEGARVVGSVGKLSRVKDHRTFLRAAAAVASRRDDVIFLLVGDGPLRGELEEFAAELGLTDRVRFTGERRDVPSLLKLMDVFVLSSTSEGLPNAVMEAMASSLPVVATDVGGVSQLVVDGESGRLAGPGDADGIARAVAEILDDPRLASRMGSAGFERVRSDYDIDSSVKGFEGALMALLRGAGRSAGGARGRVGPGADSVGSAQR